jgi:hypothetical protein
MPAGRTRRQLRAERMAASATAAARDMPVVLCGRRLDARIYRSCPKTLRCSGNGDRLEACFFAARETGLHAS